MNPKQPSYREFATIDLGSNSFHMIIARIMNGSIQIISRIKRRVRLAEGLDEHQVLSQAAIERGISCLSLFAKRLKGFEPENVKVIGTYTLRRAVNNQAFLMQAKAVFPYPIEIISGQEEAKLIYAGVSHTQADKGRKLVVDIGGGSTEMSIGDGFIPLRAESRHMGCVSFAKYFFHQDKPLREQFEQAYYAAMRNLDDLGGEYRQLGWQNVFGSSGTIKAVSRVLAAKGHKDGLITESRLVDLIEHCLQFSSLTQIELNGLLKERSDVLMPGLAILLALFHTFKIQRMHYSDGALREGVMYGLETCFQVKNIRERTANALAEQFSIDQLQAKRVRETALRLFDQVTCWKNPRQIIELRSLIQWASHLHEVGIAINHNGMQYHSAYIIANRELPGFDREQQYLLVLLIKYHLKGFKRSDIRGSYRYQYRDILTLLRLFRLAVLLNRSRQATNMPKQLNLSIEKSDWRLTFEADFLLHNVLIAADLAEENIQLQNLGLTLVYE